MGKKSDKPLQTSPDRRAGWATAAPWLAAATLILAGCLAYANSFKGVFLFDDETILLDRANELWPPGALQWSATAVPDFTFCLNYYFDKFNPAGWHAVNLAVHLLAGLTLFGLIRRTMLLPEILAKIHLGNSTSPLAATILAAGAALLWMLHPLQTESVTYIVQRQTAMMGLFYLLTIYCLLRGSVSQKLAVPWYIAAVLACALGMRSKQVMVTAPLMALLFDRTFLAGTFKRALRLRWPLYIALACTWALLYVSAHRVKTEEETIYRESVTNLQYALTQFGVIVHYLRLCVWPYPQCLDYSWPITTNPGDFIPPMIVIIVLLGATAWALWKKPVLGFLGAWFFVILAPTSSVLPLPDPAFEHRLYLSLAAVTVLASVGGYILIRRYFASDDSTNASSPWKARGIGLGVLVLASAVLASLTYERNKDYQSTIRMWRQALEVMPRNVRVMNNLGTFYARSQRLDLAEPLFRKSIEINYNDADGHANLGSLLALHRQLPEAISEYRTAIRMSPYRAKWFNSLAWLLATAPQDDLRNGAEAVKLSERACEMTGYSNMDMLDTLGAAYAENGQFDKAVAAAMKAADLARRSGNATLENAYLQRADRYRQKLPFRD
jgi:tetratricopeptide (TPR) repeat protein